MKKEDVILIAENDKKHFELIRKNLLRAGIRNKMLCLADGQEILNFLFDMDNERKGEYYNQEYILLLDLSIPRIDGVEVLEKIKQDTKLKKIPVIILTAADDGYN
jgi:CheY-like chemotaxis protein